MTGLKPIQRRNLLGSLIELSGEKFDWEKVTQNYPANTAQGVSKVKDELKGLMLTKPKSKSRRQQRTSPTKE